MNWYLFLLRSSAGKKMLMAFTGLCMLAFVSVHLLGNLMTFGGADAFNGYAAKLHSLSPYFELFNICLFLIAAIHVGFGVLLYFENRKARTVQYEVAADPGGRTLGSNTMPYTGIAILFFIVIHLLKFTFADKSETPIYDLMAATFSSFSWTVFYIAGMVVVGIHLSHGFWSLLQTFGLHHQDHTPVVEKLGLGLSIAIGVGFSLVPVYLLIFI